MQSATAWVLSLLVAIVPPPVLVGLARATARLAFLVWRAAEADRRGQRSPGRPDPHRRRCARHRPRRVSGFRGDGGGERDHAPPHDARELEESTSSWTRRPRSKHSLRQPGQGLIVASAHLGNWEVAARAASMLKPMCAIIARLTNPYLDRPRAGATGRGAAAAGVPIHVTPPCASSVLWPTARSWH